MTYQLPENRTFAQGALDGVQHTSTYGSGGRDTALTDVLGAQDADQFREALGIATIGDYLDYYPRKWEPNGPLVPSVIGLPDGQPVTVVLTVLTANLRTKQGSRWQKYLILNCCMDSGEELSLTFWNQAKETQELLPVGTRLLASGTLKTYGGRRSLDKADFILSGRRLLRPVKTVYPGKKNAPREWIEECSERILGGCSPLPEHLPEDILLRRQLPSYDASLRAMHLPANVADAHLAQVRLTYDEAFATQLTIALSRVGAHQKVSRTYPYKRELTFDAYVQSLPYELTDGQKHVTRQIAGSLAQGHPMNALLLGDVGSGKTTVAFTSLLQVVDNGGQGVLIAPTEVLAEQHYKGMIRDLEPLGVRVGLLTGSMKTSEKKKILLDLASGEIDVAVGTHALLSDKISYHNLGVVVVDEQHRFGVEQRNKLRERTPSPHMLVMTATPIPRTISMTVYGDLDVYELKGVPAGRKPVKTVVVPTAKEHWVSRLWQVMGEQIAAGHQAFIVGALIEEGKGKAAPKGKTAYGETPKTPALTVAQIAEQVKQNLPSARVGIVHGKLTSEEKDAVMSAFAAGELDVLVSTTVIEVGVNVPNATIMCVWDADRFGMAQLHQLRGRVGRGKFDGLCLLVTNTEAESDSYSRLEAVASTLDGFVIAQLDLDQRKEGDLLSESQAGKNKLKLLSLANAAGVLETAREDAVELVGRDPALRGQPVLRQWLSRMIDEDQAKALLKN